VKLTEFTAEQAVVGVEIDVKAIIGGLGRLLALASDEGQLKLAGEATDRPRQSSF
jgi:hypothetical protein